MTEIQAPIPVNDNSALIIASEQTKAKGGVFHIILGLSQYPLQAMGIIRQKDFDPEALLDQVNLQRGRISSALEVKNDNAKPSSEQQAA